MEWAFFLHFQELSFFLLELGGEVFAVLYCLCEVALDLVFLLNELLRDFLLGKVERLLLLQQLPVDFKLCLDAGLDLLLLRRIRCNLLEDG